MAKLLPLASITTMADMRAYALAEAAVASQKCPAAYNDYYKAIQILDTYSTFAGTALEITYVELARQAIKEARTTWYAVGCQDPNVASPEPSAASAAATKTSAIELPTAAESSVGGGGWGTFWLVGGALFVAMLLFSKKPSKGKKPAKKTVRKRRAPAKRRRAPAKRRRVYAKRRYSRR